SDQTGPAGRKRANGQKYATTATSAPKTRRPDRASGVVRGSEIMKKAKRSRLPLSSWWMGTASASPSRSARATRSTAHVARNARVTSERSARWTTRPPAHAKAKARKADDPHCPGEIQAAPPESSTAAARPKFVGLKTCLPRTRSTNLLPIASTAALAARAGEGVRRSRQRETPEMSALLGSKRERPAARPNTYWARRQTPMRRAARDGAMSKSRTKRPKASSPASAAIWYGRGSMSQLQAGGRFHSDEADLQ